jgi:hypothetical protein
VANLNNPAGRLIYWLELGQKRAMGNSAMAEWCAVFGLNQSDPFERAECTRRGTMLMALAREVRREAEQLPEGFHPDVMLTNFNEIESALDQFTVLPTIQMQGMYGQIQGTGWQSLKWLDAILSSHRPEQVIEHDSIQGHIEQVRDLIDSVLADVELGGDLKRYIVARLRDVEKALTDALIIGAPGLELAANSLFGASRRERDWWDRIAQTKWGPRIGAAWMAIVTTLGAAGGLPALMPGRDAAPQLDFHQTIKVEVEDPDSSAADRKTGDHPDEVVEGELVDEDEPADPGGRPR